MALSKYDEMVKSGWKRRQSPRHKPMRERSHKQSLECGGWNVSN